MKKPIKLAIIGLLVIAAIAGGVMYMLMPIPVRMTEVRHSTAELSFIEQGVVTAENTVTVFPAAAGELQRLYVREGQYVQAGDTLASVDYSPLLLRMEQVQSGIRGLQAQLAGLGTDDVRRRQDLEATRSSLQGQLRTLDAQAADSERTFGSQQEAVNERMRVQQILIDRLQSELLRAQEHLATTENLYQSGIVSRNELDTASSAAAAAQTALDAAQGEMAVIATGLGVNSAEVFEGQRAALSAQIAGINQQLAGDFTASAAANIEALIAIEETSLEQLRRDIENSVINAPISGTITALPAQHTNLLATASPVAEITAGEMHVEVFVSTQDTASIAVGDRVMLTLRRRLGDINFRGIITEIDSTAVVRFTALGIEERKVRVQIAVEDDSAYELGVGYALDVTFYVFREEERITVPRTALFTRDGQDMVWVVRGGPSGTVEAAAVTLGMELRVDTIVESGLQPGDFVINDANNADISPGTRVENER